MSDCQLRDRKMCCCTCRYHLEDYYHCSTAFDLRVNLNLWIKDEEAPLNPMCICGLRKGWICSPPSDPESKRSYSGWSEHGLCDKWAARG